VTTLSDSELIPFNEFIQKLHCSPRTGRRILAVGEIGYIRRGGSCLIPKSEFEKYLAQRFVPARAAAPVQTKSLMEIVDAIVPRRRGAR